MSDDRTSGATAGAPSLSLHQSVTLAVKKHGHAPGVDGVVIDAYPDVGRFTVELFDGEGNTLDIVDCKPEELQQRNRSR